MAFTLFFVIPPMNLTNDKMTSFFVPRRSMSLLCSAERSVLRAKCANESGTVAVSPTMLQCRTFQPNGGVCRLVLVVSYGPILYGMASCWRPHLSKPTEREKKRKRETRDYKPHVSLNTKNI